MKEYSVPKLIDYQLIEAEQVSPDIIRVDLFRYKDKSDRSWHVQVLFAYNKVIYMGDLGSYIFGKDICYCKKFFQGTDINPGYWSGKCEAYPSPLEEETVEYNDVVSAVEKYLKSKDIDIEDYYNSEFEDFKMELDSSYQSAAIDEVHKLFTVVGIEEPYYEAYELVTAQTTYSNQYLYACVLLQFVSNNLEKWLAGGNNDKK